MARDEHIQRRCFLRGSLALAGLGLLAGCGSAPLLFRYHEQPRTPRVGFLSPDAPGPVPSLQGFQQGLQDLGYTDGQNIVIEYRWADGSDERLHAFATELADRSVAVIVALTNPAAQAAKQATTTIPIVTVMNDPVGSGLVASLAHPGGNVTGLTPVSTVAAAKRLELLKEVIPTASRVAILWNPDNAAKSLDWQQLREAAPKVGLQLHSVEAPLADPDLDRAFETAATHSVDALMVLNDPVFSRQASRLATLALGHRLPTMQDRSEYVTAGSLMAYGVSTADLYRQLAVYVDKLLKGTTPADLPVEQPTRFDFVVNLKTAQALGITIPSSVLQQATEVIQ